MKTKHKIIFAVAGLMALASWIIAIYYWSKLPAVIPTHFGISGAADGWADKSIFSVFLLPALNTVMLAMFIFLYHKPQYSDMPTTMWLTTLDDKQKDHAFSLIRSMMAGMSIWIGVLFLYITYGSNVSAIDSGYKLSTWFMLVLIGAMLIWLAFWAIKVYRTTKEAVAVMNKKRKK